MGGRPVVAVCRTTKTGLSFACEHEPFFGLFYVTDYSRTGETQVLLSRLKLILLTLRGIFPTAVLCMQSAAMRLVSILNCYALIRIHYP